MLQVLCPGTKVKALVSIVSKDAPHWDTGTITESVITRDGDQLAVNYGVEFDAGDFGTFAESDLDPQPGMVILIVDYQ